MTVFVSFGASHTASYAFGVLDTITGIFRCQFPSLKSFSGFCVIPGLTAHHKTVIEGFFPFIVGGVMIGLVLPQYAIATWGESFAQRYLPRSCRRPVQRCCEAFRNCLGYEQGDRSPAARLYPHTVPGTAYVNLVDPAEDATEQSLRARCIGAAVSFLLVIYPTVTLAVARSLNCVSVKGKMVLFVEGTEDCDFSATGWQAKWILGFVVLA
jgi:hypothetical protein